MLVNALVFIIGWFMGEFLYFKFAQRYSIVDKPNARSSHQHVTIRGGGIIFPIAILIGLSYESLTDIIMGISLLIIAVLSFADDVNNIDSKFRLLIQSIAVGGMLFSVFDTFSWFWLLPLFVLVTGVINAYNFMDGINGITVLYSLVTLCSMYWVQQSIPAFLSDYLFITLLTALLVFGFFNVRKKAACFSGDIGSVSLAFIFCFLLLKMTIVTDFKWWILFLGVYGMDTVFTIVCRIFRKEPLIKAHRSHFYQYLANEAGWTHVQVSVLYAVGQLVLNISVLYSYTTGQIWVSLAVLFAFVAIYTIFRFRLEGHKRLFVTYNHS
jgi:UDP-GlcNAc:undecaprenyl-phosphate/decaprenyl-phosphate GlcNAc-1-phosphate transferase